MVTTEPLSGSATSSVSGTITRPTTVSSTDPQAPLAIVVSPS